jgi:hypothetical protein
MATHNNDTILDSNITHDINNNKLIDNNVPTQLCEIDFLDIDDQDFLSAFELDTARCMHSTTITFIFICCSLVVFCLFRFYFCNIFPAVSIIFNFKITRIIVIYALSNSFFM